MEQLKVFVEYAPDPIGLDCCVPRFSWKYTCDLRGAYQEKYRIVVQEERGKRQLWDSGWTLSPQSVNIPYAGPALKSNRRYRYAVGIISNRGDQVFSRPHYFRMGLLRESDWRASWLKSSKMYSGSGSSRFRKDLTLVKPLISAIAYIAGLGYYEFSINGEKVGDHFLANAFTCYDKTVLYQCYDVTHNLNQGDNTIGVWLGCGWYGQLKSDFDRFVFSMEFLFQLELEYADGTRETIYSDIHNGWKSLNANPCISSSVYHGEVFDARREVPGWNTPEVPLSRLILDNGLAETEDCYLAEGPAGALRSQTMPPVRITQYLKAQSIVQIAPQRYVFDFGQNIAGICRLTVSGEEGDKIIIRHAEQIHPNGTLNPKSNLNGSVNNCARAKDTYILRGDAQESYLPHFTYHGFRYAEISGLRHRPDENTLIACVMHSDVDKIGTFSCDSDCLNTMQRMIEWTETNNLHGLPTDCCQRAERMGWLNDMTARAEQAVYNWDLALLYSIWLQDIIDEQGPKTGVIKDTCPYVHGSWVGGPVNSSFLLVPWLTYLHNNDLRILDTAYPRLKGWVAYLDRCAKDGILSYSHMGDWSGPLSTCANDSMGIGAISAITPGTLMSTGYQFYNCCLMEKMARALKLRDDEKFYAEKADWYKSAFNRAFFDSDKRQYGTGSQGCNAFALYIGAVPKAMAEAVLNNLVRDIREHGNHLTTGNLCSRYVIEVLLLNDRADVAYDLLTQSTYPSWGYMINMGATTYWERWEHMVSLNQSPMASHDHPMLGSCCVAFYKEIAGIRVVEESPGFSDILFHPCIPSKMQFACARLETRRGTVSISWRKDGTGALTLKVSIPFNCSAQLDLPLGELRQESAVIREGDTIVFDCGFTKDSRDIRFTGIKGRCVSFALASGDYAFSAARK